VTAARVTCVIPALNAAPTVAAVIGGVRASLPDCRVTVIDDGSTDGTYTVARPLADAILRFDRNRGKGAALRAGLAVALGDRADVVLTIDADGQHDTACAPALVGALAGADVAIGARDRSSEMPVGRRLTNKLSAAAVGYCIGQPVVDAQSGYRAMHASVARDVMPRGNRYEFETEFLILAGRRGYRIAFVPIPTRYPHTVRSQFRSVRDSVRIVGTLWRFAMGAQH
jgi:glycosyltransferase involved in cell wall biosynthesis